MTRNSDLTPSERSLMDMLCDGKLNKQIAGELGWHPESVSRAIGRVAEKLGAATRCQAVAMYKERKP